MSIAFVLMPFDDDFKNVYTHFLTPVLSDHGFEVRRADDIDLESQQNILSDVVRGIATSDLIVADLTGANPNVFYELGIAHTLRKQTILITQSIDDVPFDLRSYRLLEYSTDFMRIEDAKSRLSELAKGSLQGSASGTPITDFLPTTSQESTHKGDNSEATDANTGGAALEDDDRGFLDHLIDVARGYKRIAGLMSGFSGDLTDLTQALSIATGEFNRISANPGPASPVAARSVSRRLADKMKAFNSKLSEVNRQYAEIALETEDSLEFMASYQAGEHGSDATTQEHLDSLRGLRSSLEEGRNVQLGLAESMEQLPRLERRLNREVDRGGQEVRLLASNLDRTIASISRALAYYN
jgi:hypothetical protein